MASIFSKKILNVEEDIHTDDQITNKSKRVKIDDKTRSARDITEITSQSESLQKWTKFSESSLSDWLKKNLDSVHIDRASPVQQMLISAVISPQGKRIRRNVFACSPTGTGKTLAYVLPILHFLSQDIRPYFALILAPTRELAYQINEIVRVLTGSTKNNSPTMIKTLLMIGGGKNGLALSESERQGFWHGKPNIVVATPGRLLDEITKRDFLEHCGHKSSLRFDFLVLDEADLLISPSFANQLRDIIEAIDECSSSNVQAPQRQTFVLSATLTSALEQLLKLFSGTNDESLAPVSINLLPTLEEMKMDIARNPNLDQRYVLCPESVKPAYLIQALSDLSFKQVIVFCGSGRQAKLIHRLMVNLGFDDTDAKCHPVLLISNKDQKERLKALESFKSLKSRILVATGGLAGRGLDLPQVDLVINYNCPMNAVDYIHRVGRTCRKIDFARIDTVEKMRANIKIVRDAQDTCSGSSNAEDPMNKKGHQLSKAVSKFYGKSILFITQYDIELMKNIESFINVKLTEEDEIDGDNVPNILKPVAIALKDADLSIAEEYKMLNDKRKR